MKILLVFVFICLLLCLSFANEHGTGHDHGHGHDHGTEHGNATAPIPTTTNSTAGNSTAAPPAAPPAAPATPATPPPAAAPAPPACKVECPYMPIDPIVGQRVGMAAYKYDGEGPNVPANWGKLDCTTPPFDIFQGCSYCNNECGGRVQSPVDVRPGMATSLSWISGVEFNVSTSCMVKYKMASNSFKMECKEHGSCGHVMLGTAKYDLLQLHTHQHSEHSLDGKLYPSEIHSVHVHNGTQLLVIGVLFDEGPFNPEFQKFINMGKNLTHGASINMSALVGPAIKPEFLTMYQGSLTTPPCSEGVRWAVSSKILTLSKEQIEELKTMAAHRLDARPVQPMNGRPFLKM